ncbi:acyltransferase [Teredinibacter sp. KSP-S5-2]|uniref:acyltransferase family protein n=1 Tax=Teredinibacter sp. KSP-S5-2 TaxID=3034506 RepID=UPI002935319C|nr:acyltransferase [Teredinibacter sp. KSP-S5-2]WNO10644.1 acyltransferase [Teredinibacter sp. KSP-S5-2]
MKKRFLVLDSFRGLFACCVVVFHLDVLNSVTESTFFRGSSLFVEFFFVLSGFVLTHGFAYKERLPFSKFILSRFFRIFPLHLVMLLVFIGFELGKVFAYQHGFAFNNPPFSDAQAASQILPNLFLFHSLTPYTELLSFNYPSWSISVEMFVYHIFFFTLLVKGFGRGAIWLLLIATMFYLFWVASAWPIDEVKRGLYNFFLGASLYPVYKKFQALNLDYKLASFLELIALVCVVNIVVYQGNYYVRNTIATVIFGFSILVFCFERGVVSKILIKPFFVRLGELSYSIYMIHAALLFCVTSVLMVCQKFLVVEFAPIIEGKRVLDLGSESLNNILVLVIVLLVVWCSRLTYKYIEKPGQQLGRQCIQMFTDTDNNKKIKAWGSLTPKSKY